MSILLLVLSVALLIAWLILREPKANGVAAQKAKEEKKEIVAKAVDSESSSLYPKPELFSGKLGRSEPSNTQTKYARHFLVDDTTKEELYVLIPDSLLTGEFITYLDKAVDEKKDVKIYGHKGKRGSIWYLMAFIITAVENKPAPILSA